MDDILYSRLKKNCSIFMNSLRLLLTLLTLTIFTILPAQEKKCASTEHMQELMKDPNYQQNFRERMAAFNRVAEQKTSESRLECSSIVTIPVAVHFQGISSNDRSCLENLVTQQIASVNADFQGSNPDISTWNNTTASLFPGVSNGETCVEFCVATRNHPSGFGLTDGQLAITINQSNGDRVNAWSGYLNIYVRDIGNNILGYAPLGGRGNGDGVVIAKFAFGGTGSCGDVSTSSTLDRGRTLTHEIGHYFLLDHIWGNNGCGGSGDNVADTPDSDGPNYGCPSNGISACGSIDMHMNYMDYTNDECMYMFSAGQSTRMENYVQANLQNIVNNAVNACGPPPEPTCDDGIQNGDEEGVDCGGSSCNPCPEPTCDDGIRNGDEEGVDCGGSNCSPCVTPPTCDDGEQNGEETGVDCGAPGCPDCPIDCDQNLMTILILPDNYGSEITWTLTDESGAEIISGGPYTDFNREVVGAELCLPDGCYNFTIFDAFGDGICCAYGDGQYAIFDANENVLASGGQFGSSETQTVSLGGEDCGTAPPPADLCGPAVPTTVEYFNNITRVRVNWDVVPDANRYQLQYRAAGTNTWTRTSTRRTRKTLRNLSPGTEYEIQFRSRCPEGWTSFGPTYVFSTLSGRFNGEPLPTLIDDEPIEFNKLYPNPTSNDLTLDYYLDDDGEVNIMVFDMLGRTVLEQNLQQEEGVQKVQLTTQHLENGTYFLKINAQDAQIIKKFIKN